VLLAAILTASCARHPPNVVLVTLDTTRADHLGVYGDRRARTPNLDRLAAGGVVFERAVTVAPLTLPAHASLLTGLYPFAHGVRNNGNFALRADVPTLATALQGAGYRTAAFVSAFVLDRRSGLSRGFDVYDDRLDLERRGDATVAAAARWMADTAADARPFFVWVHLYDPHDPYDPPPPYREAFAGRLYDGEIALDDDAIGTLLARLPAGGRDRTAIAVAGDHGESLGEHGEATHGLFVYESSIRVPMIIAAPTHVAPGRRVPALVRTIDLAPTLLEIAGVTPPAGLQGHSLLPLVRGRTPGPPDAYSETYFPQLYMNWAALRSIQDGRWKFIDAPVPELYDLANDPRELDNVAPREPARTAALRRAFDGITGGGDGAMAAARIDRETAQKLAALGYIGAAAAPPRPSSSRADPKSMVDVFNRLRDANAAIQQRRPADAEAASRAVLQRDPDNAFAAMILARSEMEQGRYREAAGAYRRYAALVPTSADAHHWVAICLSRLGDAAGALAEEDAALTLDPQHAEALDLRGGLLAAGGRTHDAIVSLRAAVDIAPGNVAFRVGLARVLISTGSLSEADVQVRQALSLQPENPDALAASGSLLAAQGQHDAARIAFERALARRPDDDDVRLDYAGVLEQLDRRADAKAQYERLARGPDTPDAIRRAAAARLR
jgi:arylsulfatase A-like enzyme/Flp pilus assembly protein TadD